MPASSSPQPTPAGMSPPSITMSPTVSSMSPRCVNASLRNFILSPRGNTASPRAPPVQTPKDDAVPAFVVAEQTDQPICPTPAAVNLVRIAVELRVQQQFLRWSDDQRRRRWPRPIRRRTNDPSRPLSLDHEPPIPNLPLLGVFDDGSSQTGGVEQPMLRASVSGRVLVRPDTLGLDPCARQTSRRHGSCAFECLRNPLHSGRGGTCLFRRYQEMHEDECDHRITDRAHSLVWRQASLTPPPALV